MDYIQYVVFYHSFTDSPKNYVAGLRSIIAENAYSAVICTFKLIKLLVYYTVRINPMDDVQSYSADFTHIAALRTAVAANGFLVFLIAYSDISLHEKN